MTLKPTRIFTRMLIPSVAAAMLLAAAQGAHAQGTASAPMSKPATAATGAVPSADRKFAEEVAAGGMAEVAMGKLGEQRGSSDQVKQFSSRMVQDHGKANDELKGIAGAKGVTLPSGPPKDAQKHMDQFSKLSGPQFDRAFMKHMVDEHKKTISKFEKEAKSGRDPEIKGFASRTLPTLQEHLKVATSTNDAVKVMK